MILNLTHNINQPKSRYKPIQVYLNEANVNLVMITFYRDETRMLRTILNYDFES